MIKVALVNSEGEVVTIVSPSMDDMYLDGGVYADLTAIHIPVDTNTTEALAKWYRKNNEWVKTKATQPSNLHYWKDEEWHLDSDKLWLSVRQIRDAKLSWCDYTQLLDAPITNAKKAEWAVYRESLRAVPTNNASATSIENITWPTKPGA